MREPPVDIKDTLSRHKDALMRLPYVVGVGIAEEADREGERHEFIQVYVSKKVPPEELDLEEMVPEQLDGIEVHVREIGELSFEGAQ
jgi:hypothetical protein